jgi:enoyl-CoA hydratase/carnithine racemase
MASRTGGGAREAQPVSIAQAARWLSLPDASGRFAALTGSGVLILDLHAGEELSPAELSLAEARLAELPCPTIAVGSSPLPAAAAKLADRTDVRVDRIEELADVLEGIDRAPIAALVLVQLLRRGEGLSVVDGLVAESLAYSTLQSGPEFAAWLAQRPPPKPRSQESGPPVRVEREGRRLRLTLDRSERRNAFSASMRDALAEALEVAVADPSVEEVLLTGAGPAFCSGGDLGEFGTSPDPATAHAVRSTRNVARLLAACADRTRAEVHGACVGAGVELPAFAGRVVARGDARFQLPELRMGLVPGAGGTVSVPRRVGRQRAAWLALSGVSMDAETALAWGLVDEIS